MTATSPPAAAQRLHADTFVVEAHRDCYELLHRLSRGEENPIRDHVVPRLRDGGIDAVVFTVGGDSLAHSGGRDKRLLATLETISALERACEDPAAGATIVREGGQLPEQPDGRVHFVPSLEGGSPLEGSMAALETLFVRGVRSIQPTWNVRNELADGVRERATGSGFTEFGVAVLREMEQLGMVIDLAHISEPGFWHAVDVTDGELIVSHSNARAVFDHPRNLTDDQIRAIAGRGGVVGVNTIPYFVDDQRPTIDRLLDHVEHIVGLVGIEHVGMGGDYTKSDGPRSGREAHLHDATKVVPALEHLSESDELENFTAALLERGVSEQDAAALLGGNFARVIRDVLGG